MLPHLLAGHCLTKLHAQLPHAQRLTEDMHNAWKSLPLWEPAQPIEALFLFTDGSWNPSSGLAAWAVLCIVRQDSQAHRVGCASGLCATTELRPNAFRAECEAILHARAVALSCKPTPAILASDCSSALAVTHGHAPFDTADWISETAVNLMFTAAAFGQKSQSIWVHSHTACVFNGIVDALAHSPAQHGPLLPLNTGVFLQEARDNCCAWHWPHGDQPELQSQMPPTDARGTWAKTACMAQLQQFPVCPTLTEQTTANRALACHLRIAQYNCLSLRGHGATELLAKGATRNRLGLLGIQETRTAQDPIRSIDGFWVVSSACAPDGVGGCQIWLAQGNMGTQDRDELRWDRSTFSIVNSGPQILAVLASLADIRFLCVSAHAPPANSPPAALDKWWAELQAVLAKAPRGCCPLLCVDANARFRWRKGAPLPRCTRARFQGARAICVKGARATLGTCAGPSVLVP